jgi:hypothetical protein
LFLLAVLAMQLSVRLPAQPHNFLKESGYPATLAGSHLSSAAASLTFLRRSFVHIRCKYFMGISGTWLEFVTYYLYLKN